MIKVLETKDAVLDKEQLKKYLAKLASDNVLKNNADNDTYPIPRLKENCEYISLVYTLLNEHIKMGIQIHPAGEWILDNFYIIEKSAKTIEKNLTKKKYVNFPGIINNGFARVYVLANEIISNTDGKINEQDLKEYLEAYQTQKYLTMEEIWNIGDFLQIAIIEKIKNICEKIFISQMQKYKVENIVERLIGNNGKKNNVKLELGKNVSKYPFIEYMSYKLKRYGKTSTPYLEAFEEQVKKMGMTVEDVITREHFDIAVRKLSMKNSITSIKAISRMDITKVFKEINVVEQVLNQDPIEVYPKMDYTTKSYYRTEILKIAKKTKISEIFVAEQALKLSKEGYQQLQDKYAKSEKQEENIGEQKKSHVGYYLIDDGKSILLEELLGKKIKLIKKNTKAKIYILSIYFWTIVITALLAIPLKFVSLLLFIPIQNATTQIIQYILSKFSKSNPIPKIEYQEKIPEEASTMCVIPVILKNKNDVEEIVKKIEVYYLANKSPNLYFTVLGDCTSSKIQNTKEDDEILNTGVEATTKLNKKYGEIFFFAYRKREWSNSEKCYMGWERKRGLLNQFNEYLETGNSSFRINTCQSNTNTKLPRIKYIITLDADTNLTLNSAFKLIGAMSHILNKPEVDKIKNIVIKGHAIIQPRIGLDINVGRKTLFSRLFAGNGGTDLYTNAISDVYQDNFDEGIYTGKGIYDLDVFYKILKDTIPENTVLSHDLLEGSYLRCGLASDIVLMDGYPSNYNAYKVRKSRWIRGDVQILPWLSSDINFLSKYKIIDNIVRNLDEFFLLITIVIGTCKYNFNEIIIPIIILAVPMIIKLFDNIINRRKGMFKHRLFATSFSKWSHTIYMFLINLAIIPDMAILEAEAFIKSLYRMNISHTFLLEWTTADEAEIKSKNNLINYYYSMIGQIIIGILFITHPLGILWIMTPILMWTIGKKQTEENKLSEKDIEYLLEIGRKTWQYFKDQTINYMPSDNYQEDRKIKAVKRTSPTNIGLAMLSTIASYDLKYENKEDTITLLKNMIDKTYELPKWNGHLYNWYDIEKMEPIYPLDISSVDSGNFVGYLYVVKQFLKDTITKKSESAEVEVCNDMIKKIDFIINNTDFSKLYDNQTGLFSIGFNVKENKLYDSYYDLLASEARQTSLIAIAKKDVPVKHWSNLGRTLTRLREHKGLVSWGGTAFEYLMPNINIPTYPSTLIDESCKLLIMSEKEYAQKLGIPWGMSESAFSLKDFYGNYQYKTFGIPWLGLKRGLADEIVVSPYSTIIALPMAKKEAVSNLYKLEKEGLIGKYGFFDSIDYKPKKEIVKTYMAHHQGMILTSIDNAINNNIFQKRFMKNPEMQGINILLQENMPEDVIITKEKKDRVSKIKYNGYKEYPPRKHGINVISTNEFTTITNENGSGCSKINDIILNRGINIYVKDINSNKIYDMKKLKIYDSSNDKMVIKDIEFTPYSSKFILEDGNLKSSVDITIAPDCQVEIRKIELKNKGLNTLNLEVTTYEEPQLSSNRQYEAHPAFDKMFFRYRYDNNMIMIKRKSRSENDKEISMSTCLYLQNNNMEFEIDKEKFVSRGNEKNDNLILESIKSSRPLSKKIETVINPIIAMRQIIKIEPNEKKDLYVITSASENETQTNENINEYMNTENLSRVFELSKAQTEAEIRYMGIEEKNISIYQKIIGLLLNPIKEKKEKTTTINIENSNLWKHGISGDYPILLLKLREINDYYVAKEIFKVYEYAKNKGIKFELVILTNLDIQDNISDDKMQKYINQREGIFILKNVKREDKHIIEDRANLTIDAHNGSLNVQLNELNDFEKDWTKNKELICTDKELIEESKTNKSNYNKDVNEINSIDENQELEQKKFEKEHIPISEFENGYGSFNQDGNEYWIKQTKKNRIPVAWSNIMANEKFGTVITDGLGGYTWYINSKTNRITNFKNDAYMDYSPEKIIFEEIENDKQENIYEEADRKEKTYKECKVKKMWSIDVNNNPDNQDYYVCYGFGYSKYFHYSNQLEQELDIYVPKDNSAKISLIKLKNTAQTSKKIIVNYIIDWQMGEHKDNYINEEYKESLNMFLVENRLNTGYYCYIMSNNKMNKNKEIIVELNPGEQKEIAIVLGCENTEMQCIDIGMKYINNYNQEFEKTKEYWKNLVQTIKADTPLKSFNYLQNGWLVYQTIVSRMLGKTGFYQSSGGYGFRDQLQDALGMKYINPDILKNQILIHARHQFLEGDVEHWWHEDSNLGIRTRYSDDLLWLPYAVIEYIEFTGDYSILNENIQYIKAKELKKDQKDRVEVYTASENYGSIFEHCYKAIKRASKFGEHGMPLMLSGDWNDGMNKIGENGKGESVWLGFFLYDILVRFIPIIDYEQNFAKTTGISKEISIAVNNRIEAENIQDTNAIDYGLEKNNFLEIAEKLKKSLNTEGWDGRWYRRAFMDDGTVIGGINNDECKIDSISQSWAIISNAGDNDKKYIAMDSFKNYLIDNNNNLIKLLTPALKEQNLGYISSYSPGMRENGGQYTHAAIWALIAQAILKNGNEVIETYKKINPIEHTKTIEGIQKYKVEPYVIEADIYSEDNLTGRGGWTWYTGSSSWLYEAQVKYILGIRINNKKITIKPCVPDNWKEFNVVMKWKNSFYNFKYKKTGKNSLKIDGKQYDYIELRDNGNWNIEVEF